MKSLGFFIVGTVVGYKVATTEMGQNFMKFCSSQVSNGVTKLSKALIDKSKTK